MFDRFQIVLGHYVYAMLWHDGQGSELYERMCRIDRYFTPGHNALSLDTPGNELALEVYNKLCDEDGRPHYVEEEEGA